MKAHLPRCNIDVVASRHFAIKSRGGFVEGLLPTGESFILERVREEMIDEMDAVPEDDSDIRAQMTKRTREQWDDASPIELLPFGVRQESLRDECLRSKSRRTKLLPSGRVIRCTRPYFPTPAILCLSIRNRIHGCR